MVQAVQEVLVTQELQVQQILVVAVAVLVHLQVQLLQVVKA